MHLDRVITLSRDPLMVIRSMTTRDNGTILYTPFPDFEESIPAGGTVTQRTSYTLAGQLIAVRVRVGTSGNGTLSYAYGDHLGSVSAWSDAAGVYLPNSTALFEPYGGFRIQPLATVNPGVSDRGFTGHRMNNTGDNNLGLIYMNARYYLPEVGRFISADTIVPDPGNPQSYNRYSYTRNNPVNLTDPTGHRETDWCEIGTYWQRFTSFFGN